MYSHKLYATGSASGNNNANIIIPSRGKIVGVQWAVHFDSTTDGAFCTLEISRASVNEIAINAAQQSVSEIHFGSNFVTSGLGQFGVNAFFPVNVPMEQGQALYLHSIVAGTVVYTGGAIIWLD